MTMIRKALSSSTSTIQRHTSALFKATTKSTSCPLNNYINHRVVGSGSGSISNANANSKSNSRYSAFSSMPSMKQDSDDDQVLVIPPNLKFDSRAISTPIYGLDKIGNHQNEAEAEAEETTNDNSEVEEKANTNANDTTKEESSEEDNEADYDHDHDHGETSYSLSNQQDPIYALPLPERLHVPIIDFMPEASTLTSSAAEIGTIHLSEHVFGNDPIRTDILHRCVVYQRNKKRGKRNGGAKTKTIGEVSGSGAKVRAQKGGGIARAGHKRPPHWRGGAKAHGPKGSVQNYETKLNKKVRMMGVRMALSQKLKEGNLILVNSYEGLGSYKTKILAEALNEVGDIGGRYGCTAYLIDHVQEEEAEDGTLKAIGGVDINLQVASRNLHKIKVRNQKFVNVYDVLKHEKLVLSLSALEALEERYAE
jgi:large subunit ribosomal protein L4